MQIFLDIEAVKYFQSLFIIPSSCIYNHLFWILQFLKDAIRNHGDRRLKYYRASSSCASFFIFPVQIFKSVISPRYPSSLFKKMVLETKSWANKMLISWENHFAIYLPNITHTFLKIFHSWTHSPNCPKIEFIVRLIFLLPYND